MKKPDLQPYFVTSLGPWGEMIHARNKGCVFWIAKFRKGKPLCRLHELVDIVDGTPLWCDHGVFMSHGKAKDRIIDLLGQSD